MNNFIDLNVDPKVSPGYVAETAPDIKIAVVANIWIKLMKFNKIGDFIQGHKHTFNHSTLLSYGSVEVEIEGNKTIFTAPEIIYIEKEKIHKITALEPNTIATCIHALRDGNETDDIISENMLPKGISPLDLAEYKLTPLIKK